MFVIMHGRWAIRGFALLIISGLLALPRAVPGQAPGFIHYQGRLVNGTNLVNGENTAVLRLFTVPDGGAAVYAETQRMAIVDGFYSVHIGASNAAPGALASALTNGLLYLEVEIEGTVLLPRERLGSVAYALTAVSKSGDTMTGRIAFTNLTARAVVVRENTETPYETIQDAFRNAADNCTILIYPGTHTVTGGLCYEDQVNNVATNAALFLINKSHITIRGIGRPTIYVSQWGDGLALEHCRNITIHGIRFAGTGLGGTNLSNFSMINLLGTNLDVLVADCLFEDFGSQGVSQLNDPKWSERVTVQNCVFHNGGTGAHPTLGGDGAAVSGVGSHWKVLGCQVSRCYRGVEIQTSWPWNTVHDVLVADNDIEYANTGISCLGSATTNYADITISGNNVHTCKDFPGVGPINGSGIQVYGTRVSVIGNTVHDFGAFGILVGYVQSRDCLVAGNTVVSNGLWGSAGIYVVGGNDVSNNAVIGNVVGDCGTYGIWAAAHDTRIVGNAVRRGGVLAAICVSSNDCTVSGNVGRDVNVGVWVDGTANRTLVSDNLIPASAVSWHPVYDQGTNTVLLGQDMGSYMAHYRIGTNLLVDGVVSARQFSGDASLTVNIPPSSLIIQPGSYTGGVMRLSTSNGTTFFWGN